MAGLVVAASTAGATTQKQKHPKKPAHHATAISVSAAGKQYLALVAPVNTIADAFSTKANSWGNSTTNAQAEADAATVIAAFEKLDSALIDDRWPSTTQSDVRSLVSADGALIGDLQALAGVNLLSTSSWITTYSRDEQALAVAVAEIRHDLRLPPTQS